MIDNGMKEPSTLWDARELLRQRRPAEAAPLREWCDHLRMSAKVYAEVADIDRGRHHEALACARSSREAADELAARIRTA